MPIESAPIITIMLLALGALLYIMGGIRFRRWAVDDRSGIPRFSSATETIVLWLLYSGAVSFAIVILRQTLRHV